MGDGQGQGAAARKREDALNQPLAKARFSDDQTSVVILNRAGHNFRRRRAVAIYQNHQRQLFRIGALRFVDDRLTVFAAPFN